MLSRWAMLSHWFLLCTLLGWYLEGGTPWLWWASLTTLPWWYAHRQDTFLGVWAAQREVIIISFSVQEDIKYFFKHVAPQSKCTEWNHLYSTISTVYCHWRPCTKLGEEHSPHPDSLLLLSQALLRPELLGTDMENTGYPLLILCHQSSLLRIPWAPPTCIPWEGKAMTLIKEHPHQAESKDEGS